MAQMKPRRILIFSLVYYPRFIGGAEVAVKEITDRISPREIEFDMITLRKHAPALERVGNVHVYRVGLPWFGADTRSSKIFPLSKVLYMPLAFLRAISLQRKNRYDVVWPIMASYAGFAALAFKIIYPRVPMVLTIQEGDNFEKREGVLSVFFRRIFVRADRIQPISNYLADWSRKMGAICPIDVVPNGVDYDAFSRPLAGSEKERIRRECGFSDDDTVLVTASRLVHKNAIEDIISALAYLDPGAKLLILGVGPDEAKLKALVADMKLDRRVFFKGFVQHSGLPAYLQSADIFIRPSRSEGLGNSFLEAMAAGIPVIATPVGGIPDFLSDGETGLFCEADNPRSIAQKIEKLVKDKESREYIVRQARQMVEKRYGWPMIAGKMKDMLMSTRSLS